MLIVNITILGGGALRCGYAVWILACQAGSRLCCVGAKADEILCYSLVSWHPSIGRESLMDIEARTGSDEVVVADRPETVPASDPAAPPAKEEAPLYINRERAGSTSTGASWKMLPIPGTHCWNGSSFSRSSIRTWTSSL